MHLSPDEHLPDTLEFLELLGFEFGLDWDAEVQIIGPPAIDSQSVLSALQPFDKAIRQELERRGRRARSQFVGGPLNGKPHSIYAWPMYPVFLFRVARAKWAIYVCIDNDPRAFFHGYETSKPKARRRGYEIERAARHKQGDRLDGA